jgi:Family of unknown function (DUF5694)
MNVRLALTLIFAANYAPVALAETPAFDPRSWKGEHAGPPTQVLTLGSTHLNQMEKPPGDELMLPLIDKLAAFKPDIITHEALSGEQCDIMLQYKATYPGIYDDYCWGTEEAKKAVGLSVPDAMAEVEKTLSKWPAMPTAADQRKLASLFLAAGDRASAQIHWRRLPLNERRVGDGLDDELIKILDKGLTAKNETYMIGVSLAVRLGLNRLYAVDDHSADAIFAKTGEGFEKVMQEHWSKPDTSEFDAGNAMEKDLGSGEKMLAYYRHLNAPATQRLYVAFDFGAALKNNTPELYGRQYVSWYETRNLRMVANIRAAFGNKPGARVLNIVGSSHKAYYDAYLDMMHEVKLVDAEEVLK